MSALGPAATRVQHGHNSSPHYRAILPPKHSHFPQSFAEHACPCRAQPAARNTRRAPASAPSFRPGSTRACVVRESFVIGNFIFSKFIFGHFIFGHRRFYFRRRVVGGVRA
eukprot:886010-Prorocentrum_minimum.AAC.3